MIPRDMELVFIRPGNIMMANRRVVSETGLVFS